MVQPVVVQAPVKMPSGKPEVPEVFFDHCQKEPILTYFEKTRGTGECPQGMVKRGSNCESRIKEQDWQSSFNVPSSTP